MKQIIIALTGPSGIGKSTLCDLLIARNNFITPVHSTTRTPRIDDNPGFYRYLSHEAFREHTEKKEFLFWSGDSPFVDKSKGNYYGILNKDYDIVSLNDRIIIFISYKDIEAVFKLKRLGYNITIVNLLYSNLEVNMPLRLENSKRDHTPLQMKKRIECAIDYEREFSEIRKTDDIIKIYSDILNEEETYDEVRRRLIK